MISGETLAAFFLASVVLAVAPGPDNLFVLAHSALRGPAAGLIVTLGLCSGLVVHTTAVALGLSAVFQASAIAFHTLKLVGAAYLLWLAWQAFRATSMGNAARASAMSGWQCYRRGIVMNLTNPKVSLFFLAFLPQFAEPARGSLAVQFAVLGGVFIPATLLVFGAIALAAGSIGKWFAGSTRTQILLHRIAGAIFVVLAVRLASSDR